MSKPDIHSPFPAAFRVILRLILPRPDNEGASSVSSGKEEERNRQEIMSRIKAVDDRLESMEGRFDSRMKGLEEKMQNLDVKMEGILDGLLGLLATSSLHKV